MCGGSQSAPPPPPVVVTNPVADAAKNANLATAMVNRQLAMTKKQAAMSSLFSVGAQGLSASQMTAAPSLFTQATGHG